MPVQYSMAMSYNLTLQCGCLVYVSCNPTSGLSHTRILEAKSPVCRSRHHEVGHRLFLWEMLPDPAYRPWPMFVSDGMQMSRI